MVVYNASPLKVLLFAGQLLALLFTLPQIILGVSLYYSVATLDFADWNFESVCIAINPTLHLTDPAGITPEGCTMNEIIYKLQNSNTTLRDTDCDPLITHCSIFSFLQTIGFVVRPVKLLLLVFAYLGKDRFTVVTTGHKRKSVQYMSCFSVQDFISYELMRGDTNSAISVFNIVSFVAYLRSNSEYLLGLVANNTKNRVLVQILVGIAHCAACAEILVSAAMVLISLLSGVYLRKRVLFLTWNMYSTMLLPSTSFTIALQLAVFGGLSVFHILVMPYLSAHVYLICVVGYPASSMLCAWLNRRREHGAVLPDMEDIKVTTEEDIMINGGSCSAVLALASVSREDLFFLSTLSPDGSISMTNYELLRLVSRAEGQFQLRLVHSFLDEGEQRELTSDSAASGSSALTERPTLARKGTMRVGARARIDSNGTVILNILISELDPRRLRVVCMAS